MARDEVTPKEAKRILKEQAGKANPSKPQREVTKEEAKRIIEKGREDS